MHELKATYKIVTPMFIGGANQTTTDGIRPPSIKGALRFWWRALNWGRFWKESQEDEEKALQSLHQEEARLFGASMGSKENTGGQGCFLLSVNFDELSTTKAGATHKQFKDNDASRYLGYGLMEAFSSKIRDVEAGELVRDCIDEDQYFDVKLLFKHEIEPSINEALLALGLLGGLGSRVRHGLGSISLESLRKNDKDIWLKAEDKETYIQQIDNLLENKLSAKNPAPYTCFDNKTRIEMLDISNTIYKSLNNFANAMLMYRSWGKNGRVLDKVSEKNFIDDHDWSKKDTRLPHDYHPQRAVFGLPHNYGKSAHQSVIPEISERRSSPLFLHIHQLHKNSYMSISIFLPSIFLPQNEKINAGGKKVKNKIDYKVITNFLDGTDKNNMRRFPKKEFIVKGSNV